MRPSSAPSLCRRAWRSSAAGTGICLPGSAGCRTCRSRAPGRNVEKPLGQGSPKPAPALHRLRVESALAAVRSGPAFDDLARHLGVELDAPRRFAQAIGLEADIVARERRAVGRNLVRQKTLEDLVLVS